MIIQDLTNKYIEFILRNDDLPSYKKQFPELFRHYFDFWAPEKFWHKELDEKEVSRRVKMVRNRLPVIEEKLNKNKFDTNTLEVVLMVGQGTTNGHAFNYNGEFLVFLPIEGYHTENQVDIFVSHEIFHALHYTRIPDFYFRTLSEKDSIARQLITEGIATYLTKNIWKISDSEALWSDYISKKDAERWLMLCNSQTDQLFQEMSSLLRNENTKTELFMTNDSQDIRKNRGGYFIGLKLIEKIKSKYNFSDIDLLQKPRKEFEGLVLAALE